MDPISVLGVVSAMVQLTDFSIKTVNVAWKTWRSETGASAAKDDIKQRTKALKDLLHRFRVSHSQVQIWQ